MDITSSQFSLVGHGWTPRSSHLGAQLLHRQAVLTGQTRCNPRLAAFRPQGVLAVGCRSSRWEVVVLPIVAAFHSRHPAVRQQVFRQSTIVLHVPLKQSQCWEPLVPLDTSERRPRCPSFIQLVELTPQGEISICHALCNEVGTSRCFQRILKCLQDHQGSRARRVVANIGRVFELDTGRQRCAIVCGSLHSFTKRRHIKGFTPTSVILKQLIDRLVPVIDHRNMNFMKLQARMSSPPIQTKLVRQVPHNGAGLHDNASRLCRSSGNFERGNASKSKRWLLLNKVPFAIINSLVRVTCGLKHQHGKIGQTPHGKVLDGDCARGGMPLPSLHNHCLGLAVCLGRQQLFHPIQR
eukprot:m.77526 g.77526  ORF g.77526 m.77526 type:complete len:352 (+) comp9147_c0_seq2:1942-2997(+)